MKSILVTMAALTALALGATGALAGDPTKSADSPTRPTAAKQMTIEELGIMLQEGGYEPKPHKNDDGRVVAYEIKVKSGSWTIYMFAYLTGDGSQIALRINLVKVDGNSSIPASVLLSLLNRTDAIYPAYFGCYDNGVLYLAMLVPNQNTTASLLRDKITFLADIFKETRSLWNPAQWPKVTTTTAQATPPAPAPAP